MPDHATWRYYAKPHLPSFYRYRIAADDAGARLVRNICPHMPNPATRGRAWIGLAVRIGRHAYCVKWADARLRAIDTIKETGGRNG
ncbi:hypothetical protein [Sphaerimonospora thailandensis]|uniref:Uncharacterized protein n=1 Tax=Sphaerimonospora thailandensis TaxID=795644 RepID=A0A8J3R6P7_9ACTN|nr:hypothetical protein [Sphaerimonospora thailandensis]GIH70316.1 hypothetical protein Mth01_25690 [Sphaerimonospora thailandensis]